MRCLGEVSTYGESSIINRFNAVVHDMPSLSGVLPRTIQFVEVMVLGEFICLWRTDKYLIGGSGL
jgi:hypothetical protein